MSTIRLGSVLIACVIVTAQAATPALADEPAGGTLSGGTSRPTTLPPPSGPIITQFMATNSAGNTWVFQGLVNDGPTAVTIYFGGLPSLQGLSVEVNTDGSFSLPVLLRPGESGTATAYAVDEDGLVSPIVFTLVGP
jgi:hypothetical protein